MSLEKVKALIKSAKGDRETLSRLVDNIVPGENERKDNAEVSTPYKLRQEMLNAIDDDFWVKELENGEFEFQRVYEPCCGKGGFVIDIIERMMKFMLPYFDDEDDLKDGEASEGQCYKFIVENCLYFADLNPLNVQITEMLINPDGKYKLNSYTGDTLAIDTKQVFGVRRFGAIIGNPPYNTDPSYSGNKPLYNLFIDKYIDKCELLLFVVPSRWFAGGKGLESFRKKMLKRKDIRLIRHTDNASEWFKKVNISGGVNYFLKDRKYKGLCDFNGIKCDLDKYDIFTEPQNHKLIDYILDFCEKIKLEFLTSIYLSSGIYNYASNDKRFKESGETKCWVSIFKSKSRVLYVDDCAKKPDFWKVITPRANGQKNDGFGFKAILPPNEIYSQSYMGLKVNSESEAQSLLSYLNCKLTNTLLSFRKNTQHINKSTLEWIPLIPLDRIWTDDMVNAYFELDEEMLKLLQCKKKI